MKELISFECGVYGDSVPVYFEKDSRFNIPKLLKGIKADKFLIITDSEVNRLHGKELIEIISEKFECSILEFPHGEENKNFLTYEDLAERAMPLVTRDSCIIAFGGGVVGNIAGLLAGTVFRGIRFLHIPTTLIAQADSTLGIKQAINTQKGKNTIGVYHRPEIVINDPYYLDTLTIREIECGLVESIKLGLSFSPELVEFMDKILIPGEIPSKDDLDLIIKKNIQLKTKILNKDPIERKYGLKLELGHTTGHAIERILNGAWTHGEAIGLGMRIEAILAYNLGITNMDTVNQINAILDKVRSPKKIPSNVTVDEILYNISLDNKRDSSGIRFILPKEIGESEILSNIDNDKIRHALTMFE